MTSEASIGPQRAAPKSARAVEAESQQVKLLGAEPMKPCKGALAGCSQGRIGIIECDAPQTVRYLDGTTGEAWTGRHIWPLDWFGKPWSSRNPKVYAYVGEPKR